MCEYPKKLTREIILGIDRPMHHVAITSVSASLAAITLFFVCGFFGASANAQTIPTTYTNTNFWTSTHDMPVSFTQDNEGNFSGQTRTGKSFSQVNITNSIGVRLQKFTIDQAFFYISDKGIIIANSNAQALSVYLNRSA
jgi:hypothetical protein